jgi:hypothetical protein
VTFVPYSDPWNPQYFPHRTAPCGTARRAATALRPEERHRRLEEALLEVPPQPSTTGDGRAGQAPSASEARTARLPPMTAPPAPCPRAPARPGGRARSTRACAGARAHQRRAEPRNRGGAARSGAPPTASDWRFRQRSFTLRGSAAKQRHLPVPQQLGERRRMAARPWLIASCSSLSRRSDRATAPGSAYLDAIKRLMVVPRDPLYLSCTCNEKIRELSECWDVCPVGFPLDGDFSTLKPSSSQRNNLISLIRFLNLSRFSTKRSGAEHWRPRPSNFTCDLRNS